MDFKRLISPYYITRLTDALTALRVPSQDVAASKRRALEGLESLELKARVEHVRDALTIALASYEGFEQKLEVVLALPARGGLGGDTTASFELWPLTSWVASEGLATPELALDALEELTQLFTAEFDVRPFLEHHRELTMSRLLQWRDAESAHVRRLVSEGTRAYLPWGKQVTWLRDEPGVIFELIEPLRDDPSEYVRRSVANSINDMTRRHADWVVAQLGAWGDAESEAQQWVMKHALRSLVKKGHVGALELLGFSADAEVSAGALTASASVKFGEKLALEIALTSTADVSRELVADFAIHHVKSNGQRTAKVFKWKTFTLEAGDTVTLKKSHAIKPITTRRYFPGTHKVDVLINGVCVAEQEFELFMPDEA